MTAMLMGGEHRKTTRAERINRVLFFSVVAYVFAIALLFAFGLASAGSKLGQALVAAPFAIALVGVILLFWSVVAIMLLSGFLSLLSLLGMAMFLLIGRRNAALGWAERIEGWERAIAHRITAPKRREE